MAGYCKPPNKIGSLACQTHSSATGFWPFDGKGGKAPAKSAPSGNEKAAPEGGSKPKL
jgi:hypothetical protein